MGGLRRFHRREHLLLGLGGTHVVIVIQTTFDLKSTFSSGYALGQPGSWSRTPTRPS
jgi:hypothetical protein